MTVFSRQSQISESVWAAENDLVGQIWLTSLRFDTVY